MTPTQMFIFLAWPLFCFVALRFIQIRNEASLEALRVQVEALQKSLETQESLESEVDESTQDALSYGQDIVIDTGNIAFKATFQGIDVGLTGTPWIVFKVGDTSQKMLPLSEVYVESK